MNTLSINIREGHGMEEYIKNIFEEHEFHVFRHGKRQLNFRMSDGKSGDIDFLAVKDKYIFFAQIKNRPSPLDDKDFVKYERKIKHVAERQMKFACEYIKQSKEIKEYYKIDNFNEYKMVPFLITGSFWGAGDSSRKIKTIDIMWLRKLFKDGVVWYQGKHDEPLCKKIRKHQFVSSEELLEQLEQPFYREIFNIKPCYAK